MAKKKNNNLWYTIGGVVIFILIMLIIFPTSKWGYDGKMYNGEENIPFSFDCEFNLFGGQFGGTSGEDSLTCTFRNEGNKAGEKCFDIQEVKIDGAVETVLAEYKNICSGDLQPWGRSEEKTIYEPQTYRDFKELLDENKCSIYGQNKDSWTCTVRGSGNREIIYTIKAEEIE